MDSSRPARTVPAVSALTLAAIVVALLVAVGSTSYAVGVARNSVGTAQLKRAAVTAVKLGQGAVTAPKLRGDAVTGAKVRNGSLGPADLAPGTLAPRPVVADGSIPAGVADREIGRVNGISYVMNCSFRGGSGATAVLAIHATTFTNTVTGGTSTAVKDGGATEVTQTLSTGGEAYAVNYLITSTDSAATGTGHGRLDGLVRQAGQPMSSVEASVSAVGGSSRSCGYRLFVVPAA
ncbi:hypothetical protein [Nocardioides sp. 1609]|uniref:hypothetical protein n=1 Tax=Nocardioides sp. 1609 TaxID=2508327 RepID=UPI0010702131|nr:hypothetical protein [Nocardioides sp. 1609]